MFSALQTLYNKNKMEKSVWNHRMGEAVVMWNYALEVAELQVKKNRGFVLEHPSSASSWKESKVDDVLSLPGVKLISFDQCRFGLKSPMGKPMRKATRFLTNMDSVVVRFAGRRCLCAEPHREIQGSEAGHRLSVYAQSYPPMLVQGLAAAASEFCAALRP